jgi:protein SCO1/2
MNKKTRTIIISAVVALSLITTVIALQQEQQNKRIIAEKQALQQAKQSSAVAIGGEYVLTNQNGDKIDSKQFLGKIQAVYFGFSNCTSVCPTDLANITAVYKSLDDDAKKNLQLIFISIDPERDTPARLKEFLAGFDAPIMGLTGSAKEIAEVEKIFKVYSKKNAENGDEMEHSAFTYILGRDGQYASHFGHNEEAKSIAAAISNLVKK